LIAYALLMLTSSWGTSGTPGSYDALPSGALIAHALGAIEGRPYTNSQEAFEQSYAQGRRLFEVDLQVTSDGQLVCLHEGLEQQVGLSQRIGTVTAAKFMSHKYMDRYTLLNLTSLLKLAASHDDAVFITDSKGWGADVAQALQQALKSTDAQMPSRLVPQIYNPADLPVVRDIEKSVGPFRSLIFTLYMTSLSNAEVVAFVTREHIPVVALPSYRADAGFVAQLRRAGAQVLVHTLNEHPEIMRLAHLGITGFYTDVYRPFSDLFPAR
jgi:glycerophosphoryl diester phosphodiesterase